MKVQDMSDRELLELAAKVAGVKILMRDAECLFVDFRSVGLRAWNPLTDDGDALRLAVRLELNVDVIDGHSGAQALDVAFFSEPHNGDPYAATRRAIVRAAAEIGASKFGAEVPDQAA